MNSEVQKALDGDASARALTGPERAALAETRSQIDAVLRAVPIDPLPDLAPAVLERIRASRGRSDLTLEARPPNAAPTARRNTITAWLWRPRSVSITWRPAYALAAALVFATVVTADSLRQRRTDVAATAHQVLTQFVLNAPNATRVAVAGDFSGWKPVHAMTRSVAGVWTVVVPLDPGVHDYAFVVDGERWVPDPTAPAVKDGFGGVNSRLAVLSPDGGRS
jgi:hypothetical protein